MSSTALAFMQETLCSVVRNATMTLYDAVPEDATLPYATVTLAQSISSHMRGFSVIDASYDITIWSAYAGYDEALRYAGLLESVLEADALRARNPALLHWSQERQRRTTSKDDTLRSIIVRYRAVLSTV